MTTTFINSEDVSLNISMPLPPSPICKFMEDPIKTNGAMQKTRLIMSVFSNQETKLYVSDCVGFQTFSKSLKDYKALNVWCTVTAKEYRLLHLMVLLSNNFQLDR